MSFKNTQHKQSLSKASQRPPLHYKVRNQCYDCAYCDKSFGSYMKMQKHILEETCLPKDPTERWIVKFLTLEERSKQAEAKTYLDKEFALDLEEVCGKSIEDQFDPEMKEFMCNEFLE